MTNTTIYLLSEFFKIFSVCPVTILISIATNFDLQIAENMFSNRQLFVYAIIDVIFDADIRKGGRQQFKYVTGIREGRGCLGYGMDRHM